MHLKFSIWLDKLIYKMTSTNITFRLSNVENTQKITRLLLKGLSILIFFYLVVPNVNEQELKYWIRRVIKLMNDIYYHFGFFLNLKKEKWDLELENFRNRI